MQYKAIDTKETAYGKIEVLQVDQLSGSSDVRSAEQLFFIQQTGMRMKKVRITLSGMGSKVRVEPSALYFMHGNLEMKTSTGGGVMGAIARKVLTGESLFVNEIHGQGEIYLEPTFGHFLLVELDGDEIIVDKSLFYAALGDINVSVFTNKAFSGLIGGEGFFQTKIKGTGVVVLFSPVPMDEVQTFELRNETLSIDGNFALMRTGSIELTMQKSSKSWVATSVSGEGLLQTFKGTGTVWVAPTQGVYEKLATPGGLHVLSGSPGARTTQVDSRHR